MGVESMGERSLIDPAIPLIDLHRHLDGNVRLETIIDLGQQHNIPLPAWNIKGLRPHVVVTDSTPGVMAFIGKFKWMMAVLVDLDACRRVAYENVQDAYLEGLDYVELRFSPWFMAETNDLDPIGVVEAVCDGVESGREEFDLSVNLIGILSRTYGVQATWVELQALLTQKDKLVGLDLAGDEKEYAAELFADHFQAGRDSGLKVTVHAGESVGPQSIWAAIRELGASRIGHAVTALEDQTLVDKMVERRIGIESNITSNVQTQTIPDFASHPIRKFLEFGLLATINTDDPEISGIDLHHEYNIAAPAAGLSPEQISQAQRNALEVAFLSQEERDALSTKAKERG
jgi:adenosine deaminase